MFYSILRQNILTVFLNYVRFSILELGEAAIMSKYNLNESCCKFTIVFKQEYFVLIERFYEKLSESFKELQIIGWSDFEQEYLYEVSGFVTLNLIS